MFYFYKKNLKPFRNQITLLSFMGLIIFPLSALAGWGQAPQSGLLYLPYGYHINRSRGYQTFNYSTGDDESYIENDNVQLIKVNIGSIAAATFVNSFDDRSYSIGVQRVFWKNQNSSLNYTIGAVYGYNGQLFYNPTSILYKIFFQGPVNPYGDLEYQYSFNKYLSIVGAYAFVFVGVGLKVSF